MKITAVMAMQKDKNIPIPPKEGVGFLCQRSDRGKETLPVLKLNQRTAGTSTRLMIRAMSSDRRNV